LRKGGWFAIFFVQRCLIRFKGRLVHTIVGPVLNTTRLTAQVETIPSAIEVRPFSGKHTIRSLQPYRAVAIRDGGLMDAKTAAIISICCGLGRTAVCGRWKSSAASAPGSSAAFTLTRLAAEVFAA
jgi:hypothetical protein